MINLDSISVGIFGKSGSGKSTLLKEYAKKSNQPLKQTIYDIHLVSLARNLRILGNWINLYRNGKPQYLKKYRNTTWIQIFKHVEYLRFWDLRELFEEVYKKTK